MWSTGLFELLADPLVVLECIVCPYYVMARSKAAVDGRPYSLRLCDMICCPSEYATRRQLRVRYGLLGPGSGEVLDALVCCLCCPFVVCQDAREAQLRLTMDV